MPWSTLSCLDEQEIYMQSSTLAQVRTLYEKRANAAQKCYSPQGALNSDGNLYLKKFNNSH